MINDLINLGLGANVLELSYRNTIKMSSPKDAFFPLIDLPQHFVAAGIASVCFSISFPLSAACFVGMPLLFKAVKLSTNENSTLNKVAEGGDHVTRLASKITILLPNLIACMVFTGMTTTQAWVYTRTVILLYTFTKDLLATLTPLLSNLSFIEGIALDNKLSNG